MGRRHVRARYPTAGSPSFGGWRLGWPCGELGGAVLASRRMARLVYSMSVRRTTYIQRREVAPAVTTAVHAALKEYPARLGCVRGSRKLRITPARKGSGLPDASVEHDRYLAGR